MGELGKVFSTAPEIAVGEDGKTYFIKGRNSGTAFAEVVGCKLAALAGLTVPPAHVGIYGDDRYAAVEAVPTSQRSIEPWLSQMQRIRNRSQLYEVVAVDTWLVNDDRNMGNLVGGGVRDGTIDVYMIDFEKSRTLGESPFMSAGAIDPSRLWPTAQLGHFLRPSRPAAGPFEIVNRIMTLSHRQIQEIVLPVAQELPIVTWHDASVDLLHRRAQNLDTLVRTVWHST